MRKFFFLSVPMPLVTVIAIVLIAAMLIMGSSAFSDNPKGENEMTELLTAMPLSPHTATSSVTAIGADEIVIDPTVGLGIDAFPDPGEGELGSALLCSKDFRLASPDPADYEVVTYTARNVGASKLTGVIREVEGTAREWPAGTAIACYLTAEHIKRINTNITQLVCNVGDSNGVDDTDNIQAVINAAPEGSSIYFPDTTYIVTSLEVNKTLRFFSRGSTICFKSGLSSSTDMFKVVANGITVEFENIIFDGNKDNITIPNEINLLRYCIIVWVHKVNAVVNSKSFLTVKGCKFLNVPSGAIGVSGYADTANATTNKLFNVRIVNNYFEKGFENAPGYKDTQIIGVFDHTQAIIEGNMFHKNEEISLYGLGAIVVTTSDTTQEVFSTVTIRDNYFDGYGRQGAAGLGAIGVIEFYASCKQVIVSGNKLNNNYYTAIRGKSNSKECIITDNVINGMIVNENTSERSYGIAIVRGTYFDIYDKYIITNNTITNVYGNGIMVVGSNSAYTPSGKIKDVIVTGNIIETIVEETSSYGIYVVSFENTVIANNVIRNYTHSVYLNDFKKEATVSNNQIFDSRYYGVFFQGYYTGEAGYTDYDCNVTVQGNIFRTSLIQTGYTTFRFIYLEKLSDAVVVGNIARNDSAQAAQDFIRTGLEVQNNVTAYNNLVRGGCSFFSSIISGTFVQANNLLNGVLVT